MRDSDTYFIPQGALKLMTPAWKILTILIKSCENVF